MQYNINYSIDLTPLKDFVEQVVKQEKFSNLIEAVKVSGEHVTNAWIRNANSVLNHTQESYVNGIVEGVQYPYEGNPLTYTITNKSPHAHRLEYGNEAWDMKKFLTTSDKIRMNKKGEKYLVIPFRHGVPGTKGYKPMPKEVYKEAKNLGASIVTGHYYEGSIKGAETPSDAELLREFNGTKVKRRKYKWGDKISVTNTNGVKSKYDGMYRFETNVHINRNQNPETGKFVYKNSTGQNNIQHSIYMTFRVMKEGQEGWIYPQRDGKYILRNTVTETETVVKQMLMNAATEDLKNLLNGIR